jgi:hypothetical protein
MPLEVIYELSGNQWERGRFLIIYPSPDYAPMMPVLVFMFHISGMTSRTQLKQQQIKTFLKNIEFAFLRQNMYVIVCFVLTAIYNNYCSCSSSV